MKRKLLLLLFTTLLLAPIQAQAADVFLLGFTGFDYEDPDAHPANSNPNEYLEFGDGYRQIGFVTSVGPLLAPYYDPATFEYTFFLFNMTVVFHSYDAGLNFLQVQFADNGRARYFEDDRTTGTPALYLTNPPVVGEVPDKFIDGSVKLGGNVDQMALVYDYNANQGSFVGYMTQDEGTALIYIPPAQRTGWRLGGLLGRPNATVPEGYDNQLDGECRIPDTTPTAHKTWGAVKSLYR